MIEQVTRQYQSTNFITGLRGIAIMMVFLIHAGGEFRQYSDIANRIVDLGKYGVEIFFVISGFTIFYQFFERNYSFKKFLTLRIVRISIPYFPIILLLFLAVNLELESQNIYAIQYDNGDISFLNLLLHMLYINYFDVSYANSIIGVEWTLSIEVFYYLFFGYLIYKSYLNRYISKNLKLFIGLFILSISIALLSKLKYIDINLASWLPFKYGYMFLLGGIAYFIRKKLSELYTTKKLKKLSNIILLLVVFMFSTFMIGVFLPNSTTVNELFFNILTFILIIFTRDDAILSKILTNKIIIFLGSISFSFYLLHILVIEYLSFNNFFYSLIVSIAISFIWYFIFENYLYKKVKRVINESK